MCAKMFYINIEVVLLSDLTVFLTISIENICMNL